MEYNTNYEYDIRDKSISFVISLQILIMGIKNMLVQGIPFLYNINNYLNLILISFCYFFYFITFLKLKFIKKEVYTLFIFTSVIFSILATWLVLPQNNVYMVNSLIKSILYCFLTCILLIQLNSFKWLKIYMYKFAKIIVIISCISSLFIAAYGHTTSSEWFIYSMPLSYVTMWGVMWILNSYFENENLKDFVYSLIGILIIVIFGSRNPLLAIGAFIIIKIISKSYLRTNKYNKYYRLVLLMTIVGFVFYKQILLFGVKVLDFFNLDSRTLELLLAGNPSSGRDEIHSILIDEIIRGPFFGFGVCGDEFVLSQHGMSQGAHSLYLSILSNFGIFIGTIIILTILFYIIKSYRICDNIDKNILLIYICLVIPRGFTGGDIWSSDVFWWLIGLIFSVITRSKKNVVETDR